MDNAQDVTMGSKQDVTMVSRQDVTMGRKQDVTMGRKQDVTMGRKQDVTMGRKQHKALPIGISSFYKMLSRNYFYVDKTFFIQRLLETETNAILFTRPRRFGKTLAMDMLRRYLDCNEREQNLPLFDGLSITRSERCMAEQGKYPVIFLSFKDVNGSTQPSLENDFRTALLDTLESFDYLLHSDKLPELKKERLRKVMTADASVSDLSHSLRLLSSALYEYHHQPAVILIDEYDTPLQVAYINGFYQPICDLMRTMFSSALKDNDNLRLGVITGITRIAKDSLFSGLNNLEVDTILSKRFADCFGFTSAEVDKLAEYYGAADKRNEIEDWYDGYRFGDQDIYNPWSLLQYFKSDCEPCAYWLDTSSNDLTRKILSSLAEKQHSQILALHQGGYVEKRIDISVSYQQLENLDSDIVFSLMTVSGYLKPVKRLFEGQYRLVIPNKEIKSIYSEEIIAHLQKRLNFEEIRSLRSAIIEGERQRFADLLRKYMVASISGFDTVESFYHGWLLGLMIVLDDEYTCQSNREAGDGRLDLMLIPRPGREHPGMIFELKRSRTVRQMQEKAAEALRQIEEKNYIEALPPQVTEVVGYGIAFCRKRCEVVQRVWTR